MIEKLRKKIFYLVFISISIIVLGVIILFAILNYHSTINTAVMMINRMTQIGLIRENPEKPPKQENIEKQKEIEGIYHVTVRNGNIDNNMPNNDAINNNNMPNNNDINNNKPNNDVINNNIPNNDVINNNIPNNDVINNNIPNNGAINNNIPNNEDINNNILDNDNINKKIEEYALEISKKNIRNNSGIIGKYIYNVKRRGENTFEITFMENEDAIIHANSILIVSVILCIISVVAIYIGAKKIAKMIVKPVGETFEKQKQFISDASHELKTPLAVIEANADVLENEIQDNKWIKYIQNEIESMNKLINELLMLAKIENIDSIRELKQIDLSKELEIIIAMYESMAYEKEVKIDSNIKENILLKANKEDIEHIVSTLLDNAIKHTELKKQVIVELNKEKNDIIILVKNYGEPIPDEEREKIFERFYRVDKSRNRKEKRYGLGLAIAKSTVEKYNGKIEVSYKNHFTIFKVYIPV